jgi:hypothetical protein
MEAFPDGKIEYWYAKPGTLQTTLSGGKIQIFQFSDGQVEKWDKEIGQHEITFANGTVKTVFNNGDEEIKFNDGRYQKNSKEGKIVEFVDGTRQDTLKTGEKIKYYPNGVIRVVRVDGVIETKWHDGRITIKKPDHK